MKAVRVREVEAEMVRMELLSRGTLDRSRKIIKRDGFIEIPVTDWETDIEVTDQEKPEFYIPEKTLGSILDIPEYEKNLLPSGCQVLGDVIIITLREELMIRKFDIGGALLKMHPRCRTVLLDRGIIGQLRLPEREIIAGDTTETTHRENGCVFKLDAMRIMYSQGNLAERNRMSRVGKDEVVVDMFAGIGYFSIPMAVHGKPAKIYAIEINPVSFNYLTENIMLNNVEDIIEPVEGDCALVTPHGIADRVIMGYLDAHPYLEQGICALKTGGILHYHEAVPEAVEQRPVERIAGAAGKQGRKTEVITMRRIKKYSPGVWHVVVDARVF